MPHFFRVANLNAGRIQSKVSVSRLALSPSNSFKVFDLVAGGGR